MRPGIEPASSWILVGRVTAEPQPELKALVFYTALRITRISEKLVCLFVFRAASAAYGSPARG